jgi:hypothetical protein
MDNNLTKCAHKKWTIAHQMCTRCNLINGMNSPTNKGMSSIHTQKLQAKNEKNMSESFKGPSLFKPPSSKMSSLVVFTK